MGSQIRFRMVQKGGPLYSPSITFTRRVTTAFLLAIPPQINKFDAYLYAVVKRKPEKETSGKWGKDVRIEPCFLNWDQKTIEMRIPLNINKGIKNMDDLDENFFETIQAAFIALMYGCLP